MKKFRKDYFSGYLEGACREFDEKELTRASNFFWGWFEYLNRYFNFKNGKGKKVLEVGCSIGGAANFLYERGFDVYASDISAYAIKKAKKLLPQIKFFCFDVQKVIPLREKFNLILAFEAIEHLDDPLSAIKNMYSSLLKDGVIICSTPYPYSHSFIDPTHINIKYPKEWLFLFKYAGFKTVKSTQVSFIPFFYRLHKKFNFYLPFGIDSRFINSPIFIIGKK